MFKYTEESCSQKCSESDPTELSNIKFMEEQSSKYQIDL